MWKQPFSILDGDWNLYNSRKKATNVWVVKSCIDGSRTFFNQTLPFVLQIILELYFSTEMTKSKTVVHEWAFPAHWTFPDTRHKNSYSQYLMWFSNSIEFCFKFLFVWHAIDDLWHFDVFFLNHNGINYIIGNLWNLFNIPEKQEKTY